MQNWIGFIIFSYLYIGMILSGLTDSDSCCNDWQSFWISILMCLFWPIIFLGLIIMWLIFKVKDN